MRNISQIMRTPFQRGLVGLVVNGNQKNQDLISDMIVVTVINGESDSRYNGNLKSSLGGNDQQPLLGV